MFGEIDWLTMWISDSPHGCHPGTVTCVAALAGLEKKEIDTQVPSQRTLVLNIVNSFKTDD